MELAGQSVHSKSVGLVEGYQILANPVVWDVALQDMALNGTGSAIYTNCDKVSTGVSPYQTSGLGTNGVWYFANSTNEWSAQSN